MSGISKNEFLKFISFLNGKEDVNIYIENNINYRTHVNSLFYLFRLDVNTLAIVIQLKNNHMADRGIEHEADDLTKGNTIYIFDLNGGEDTKNVLVTLICADAIQLSMSELITNLKYKHPLVVNAQCNSKPFDHRFVRNRSFISSDQSISKQRQIIVNWAKGTKIEKAFTICDSGNTYYNYLGVSGHSHLKSICSDQEVFTHRMKNQIKGCTYFANDSVNIWRFPNDENILKFYVKKEDVFGVNPTLSSNFDPVIKEKYKYEKDEWVQNEKYCLRMEEDKSSQFYMSDNKLLRPLIFQQCKDNTCNDKCIWLYNDYFLSICLGGELKNEFKCDGEISNRALIAMNDDSVERTSRKRELFSTLVKLLETNEIPDELNVFSNNVKFEIDCNAAECGSNNIYNVVVDTIKEGFSNWSIKKGIFAVIDTTQLETVEKVYSTLYQSTNEDNRDQILLYYRKDDKYIAYKKPHESKSIVPSNSTFTRNTTSIFIGGSQYDQD
jgi:hypothetical protein